MLSLVVLLRLWWLWRSMWIADISVLLHPIIKARMRGLRGLRPAAGAPEARYFGQREDAQQHEHVKASE